MRNSGSVIFWIILFIFLFGSGIFSVLLPLIILVLFCAGIGTLITKGSGSSKSQQDKTYTKTNTYSKTNVYSSSTAGKFTPSQMAMLNVFLRRYFGSNRLLKVMDDIDLRMNGSRYTSISVLDVYQSGRYVCSLDEFGARYPASYDQIMDTLMHFARNADGSGFTETTIVDAEATEHAEVAQEPKDEPAETAAPKHKNKLTDATDFIDEINRLNTNIQDEPISNGLYETCALLKQIQALEQKFPDSRSKLDKLYEYYLPILTKILDQFDNLQSAKTDPNYEPTRQKLTKTLDLINEAMKTIIASMTDQDFINLSADISTLEAVLQKDGYAGDIRMNDHKEDN